MKGFTGVKDLDLKILMDVDDETLLNACLTNKELYRICNVDQYFWRDRYIKKYGQHAAQFKPQEQSWKNHYLQSLIDLQTFKNPMDFFSIIVWKENVEKSFYIDKKTNTLIPLSNAPRWVMNNLYSLKLEDIDVIHYFSETVSQKIISYKKVTPIELLNNMPLHRDYIFGFSKYYDMNRYRPDFNTLQGVRRYLEYLKKTE